MSTTEARTFARALYETLISNAVTQLQAIAPRIDGTQGAMSVERVASTVPQGASPEVRNFLAVLASENALDQLPEIIGELEAYIKSGTPQILDGAVTSAVDLSAEQQKRITSDLQQRYGEQLTVSFKTDPSLIGGLIIRVGDQVLDNSLRTRLSVVQRSMQAS